MFSRFSTLYQSKSDYWFTALPSIKDINSRAYETSLWIKGLNSWNQKSVCLGDRVEHPRSFHGRRVHALIRWVPSPRIPRTERKGRSYFKLACWITSEAFRYPECEHYSVLASWGHSIHLLVSWVESSHYQSQGEWILHEGDWIRPRVSEILKLPFDRPSLILIQTSSSITRTH